jgi:hypothetical protein
VPENVRYEKTASVMRYHGYLAVFWNMYPGMEGKINQEFDQIYRQRTPEIVKPDISFKEVIRSRANSLRMCSYFEKVEVRQYPWSVRYSTNEYIGLLNTYSDHLRLPEERRSELFHDIAEIIDRNGGYIDRPYLAVVYLARRNGC